MADTVNARTQNAIRAICRDIVDIHCLDAELEKELYGHIEDKVLGYLRGDEALSPEDAVILARAHFGDPAALKQLLVGVHAVQAFDSLARRLAALMAATVAAGLAGDLLGNALASVLARVGLAWLTGPFALGVQHSILSLALLWLCLWYWQRRVDAGKRVWFRTWPASRVIIALGIVFATGWAIEFRGGYLALTALLSPLSAQPDPMNVTFVWVQLTIAGMTMALNCILWLWWCDVAPRLWQNLVVTALAWVLYLTVIQRAATLLFEVLYASDLDRMAMMAHPTHPVLVYSAEHFMQYALIVAFATIACCLATIFYSAGSAAWRQMKEERV
jgi:hypothetical protein